MPRYVAFLRGINVGGHRVKMDRLAALFTELGLEDVSTFIASGNVLFSTDSADGDGVRKAIETHLEAQLGYEVATFLRTPAALAAITTLSLPDPVAQAWDTPSHYVIFVDAPIPDSLRSNLTELDSETDRFHFSEAEVHWLLKGKMSESPLFDRVLDRATKGFRTTTRNMNTIRRIAAKTGASKAS